MRSPAAVGRLLGHLLQQGAVRTRRASPIRRPSPRWSTAAGSSNDPKEGISGFVARGLKNANVPVWSSFLLGYGGDFVDAKGKLHDGQPGGDRGARRCTRRCWPRSARRASPASTGTECQARSCRARRHVARRHRLRAAARGSDQVAHRRQGRLRRHAGGPEGAGLRDVRRRHRGRVQRARRSRRSSIASGRRPSRWARGCCRAAAARRCAIRCSATRRSRKGVQVATAWVECSAGIRPGSRSPACRSSCRSPSSATSSASR